MAFPPATQPTIATDSTQTPGWLAPRLNALGQAINDFLAGLGAANGIATLGSDGHVPAAQLKPPVSGFVTLSSNGATVFTSAVTATSVILLTVNEIGSNSNVGFPVVTARSPGVSFTIGTQTSPLNDNDVVGWLIV